MTKRPRRPIIPAQGKKPTQKPAQKEDLGFFKKGFGKLNAPWCWVMVVKGIILGGIVTFLYLEGWPF